MPNFLLITLLSAFPALSTDMYLPAIPTLQETWNISLVQANLSLVAYFATFSVLLLVHGPLSDKYGRKPILIGGITLFVAGSLLCAYADSINALVIARMVQATGAAAASALSLALAKDLYEGAERQKVFAYIGVILPLCPMLAPVIGGFMLKFLSWRWIFMCQAFLALASLYGSIRLKEPEFERTTGGVLSVVNRYIVLFRNPTYITYTIAFCTMSTAFFSFIAGSASLYITDFGVSAQTYGLYFGFVALTMMCGSLLCSRLCVDHAPLSILKFSLSGMFVAGVAMLITKGATPLSFMFPMGAISFCLGLSRPISNNFVLEQVERDVGAASSFLTFCFFLCGALSMELISHNWFPKPMVTGTLALVGSSIPLAAILLVGRKRKSPHIVS